MELTAKIIKEKSLNLLDLLDFLNDCGAETSQDWYTESTSWHFDDQSSIKISGTEISYLMPITERDMQNIATYMDDTHREELHGWGGSNIDFLKSYISRDPAFAKILKTEFPEIHDTIEGA
jgi:hypothetical protein